MHPAAVAAAQTLVLNSWLATNNLKDWNSAQFRAVIAVDSAKKAMEFLGLKEEGKVKKKKKVSANHTT